MGGVLRDNCIESTFHIFLKTRKELCTHVHPCCSAAGG